MWIGVLGPLCVRDGERELPVSAGKQRTVLAALIMRVNQAVSADALADTVWDGLPPPEAGVTLRNHIRRLRRSLGGIEASRIATRTRGYLIRLGDEELDLTQFETKSRHGDIALRAGDWHNARELFGQALALWRGTMALVDIDSQILHRDHVSRLDEQRLHALEGRTTADLHLDRHDRLIPELRDLARQYPTREAIHALLMLALARSGRPAEALDAYRDARRVLSDDFGIDPGAELQQVHKRILDGDYELDSPTQSSSVNRPVPSVVPPRQLPGANSRFTGRMHELVALDELLPSAIKAASAVAIVTITGMPGVGKTALAVYWGRRAAEQFPDGQLYVDLRGFDQRGQRVEPHEALREFLSALHVSQGDIPTQVDQQAALFRSILADKRVLVVLDNAQTADQLRPLLPGSPTCLTLVTSRNDLVGLIAAGAHALRLDLLTPEDALTLLTRYLGRERTEREPQAVNDLIQMCACLPLALTVIAARAALRPASPLEEFCDELKSERLTALATRDFATDVETVFSWSYTHLSTPAKQMFRVLGLSHAPSISLSAAASLRGVALNAARRALDELVQAHLIEASDRSHFTFHDLLRDYAAKLAHATDSDTERHDALHRALSHYLHTGYAAARLLNEARPPLTLDPLLPGATSGEFADIGQALTWFDAERDALLTAVPQAADRRFDRDAWQIAWTLADYLDRRGHWDEMITIHLAALDAVRRLGDLSGEARTRGGLARAYRQLGRHEHAMTHLRELSTLFQRLRDNNGRSRAHRSIAQILEDQHRYQEALDHAQQADQHATDPAERANAQNAVGWYHTLLGNYSQGQECCERSRDLHRDNGDCHGQAAACDSLGLIHHLSGNYPAAISSFTHALNLFETAGDRYKMADTLIRLSQTHQVADDTHLARDTLRQAESILNDLGHPRTREVQARLRDLDTEKQ